MTIFNFFGNMHTVYLTRDRSKRIGSRAVLSLIKYELSKPETEILTISLKKLFCKYRKTSTKFVVIGLLMFKIIKNLTDVAATYFLIQPHFKVKLLKQEELGLCYFYRGRYQKLLTQFLPRCLISFST